MADRDDVETWLSRELRDDEASTASWALLNAELNSASQLDKDALVKACRERRVAEAGQMVVRLFDSAVTKMAQSRSAGMIDPQGRITVADLAPVIRARLPTPPPRP